MAKNFFNSKGEELKELAGYIINVPNGMMDVCQQALYTNQPISGEIIGYLVGNASPIYKRVNCEICKKVIKVSEWIYTTHPDSPANPRLHTKCLEEAQKKIDEADKKDEQKEPKSKK